jgi:hypothetical protein
MKKFLVSLVLFTTSAFAGQPQQQSINDKILTALDNICGDTWCEGVFDFYFSNISIIQNKVLVRYEMFSNVGHQINPTRYSFVCKIEGFTGLDNLIDNNDSLNQEFYDKISDCIGDNENKLRQILGDHIYE